MTTRPVLPGGPIVEHIKAAPTPLMGIGAILMFTGFFVFIIGAGLSETLKMSRFIWLGLAGGVMMLLGPALMVYDIERMKRRERKPGS